jgi:hypothetical protein
VIELKTWDAVRVPGPTMRCLEAGPEGAEVTAVGAPSNGNADAQMTPDWWTDQRRATPPPPRSGP